MGEAGSSRIRPCPWSPLPERLHQFFHRKRAVNSPRCWDVATLFPASVPPSPLLQGSLRILCLEALPWPRPLRGAQARDREISASCSPSPRISSAYSEHWSHRRHRVVNFLLLLLVLPTVGSGTARRDARPLPCVLPHASPSPLQVQGCLADLLHPWPGNAAAMEFLHDRPGGEGLPWH